MMVDPKGGNAAGLAPATTGPLQQRCVSFLQQTQNEDGGWGYRLRHRSAVEPTCSAIAALNETQSAESISALERACGWLDRVQLPDGSWPCFPGQATGSWATALACMALGSRDQSPERISRALLWLRDNRPAESGFWWRIRNQIFKRSVVDQDSSLVGWSWIPGTASWVEPTAYCLILLRAIPDRLHPSGMDKRRELAEKMLYNRMCPGGGWNSGNPLVYGVAGEPRVIPTAWALLALSEHASRAENSKSLDWLEGHYKQIRGPASLALAHLCLRFNGRLVPQLEPEAERLYSMSQFFEDTLSTAWMALALTREPKWLGFVRETSG